MNRKRIVTMVFLIFAILVSVVGMDPGQPASKRKNDGFATMDGTGFVISDERQCKRLFSTREAAIRAALKDLGDPAVDHDERARAIWVLEKLRASDFPETVGVLLDNITFFDAPGMDEDHPLLGFRAAEAIAEIGSPAMPRLMEYLGAQRTNNELRLVAFIIERIDGRELGALRIQLQLRHLRNTWPHLSDNSNPHVKNLGQLEQWFADKNFFENLRNWPFRQ